MKSRFRLTENPLIADSDGVGILHTQWPRLHIEALHDEEIEYTLDDVYEIFNYPNPDGVIEEVQLIVRDFYDHKSLEAADKDMKAIRQVLKRAVRWYMSYLAYEDAESDKNYGNPKLN